MKEVHTTQEPLQLNLVGWARHRSDGIHLGWEGHNASRVHDVAEVRHLGLGQNTLLAVETEASGREATEDLMKIFQMLVHGGAGHQYIIEIHKNSRKTAQDPIHQALKCLRRVFKAKRHP